MKDNIILKIFRGGNYFIKYKHMFSEIAHKILHRLMFFPKGRISTYNEVDFTAFEMNTVSFMC